MKYVFALAFLVCSCTNEIENATQEAATPVVYFLGDSITEGWTLPKPTAQRWTTLLCAQKGWTEKNYGIVSQSLQDAGYPYHPVFDKTTIPGKGVADRYLFLALGVNDELGATNCYPFTAKKYSDRLQEVLDYAAAKGWKGGSVVLLTPFYVNGGAVPDVLLKEAYRQAVIAKARANHTALIDVSAFMQQQPDIDRHLPDFVHPDTTMHQRIANYLNQADYAPQ